MAYTRHGHHIPGTPIDDENPPTDCANCGSFALCQYCIAEAVQAGSGELIKLFPHPSYMDQYGNRTVHKMEIGDLVDIYGCRFKLTGLYLEHDSIPTAILTSTLEELKK